MQGVGILIKIGIHTLMEHEEKNKIQKQKKNNLKNFQTQEIPHGLYVILYFEVFAVLWCFVHLYFDSFTTPNQNILFA